MEPLIYIDTREQMPIEFTRSINIKLIVGDYTTKKHFNKLHLERKSPADLYGTILSGHKRFHKELRRAFENQIGLIMIIECTEEKFYSMRWRGGKYCKVKPETLKKIIETIKERYRLNFIWCTNRKKMKFVILKLLK